MKVLVDKDQQVPDPSGFGRLQIPVACFAGDAADRRQQPEAQFQIPAGDGERGRGRGRVKLDQIAIDPGDPPADTDRRYQGGF